VKPVEELLLPIFCSFRLPTGINTHMASAILLVRNMRKHEDGLVAGKLQHN
jgi:hypothetical protein